MNYVYILLLDDIPIYAGMTNNPVERFRRHYMAKDCRTHYVLKYYLFEKNKIVKMKLVYCSPDRNNVGRMESFAIESLRKAGFNIINVRCEIYPFLRLNKDIRIPSKTFFTKKDTQYIVDNQTEILKEYGYE